MSDQREQRQSDAMLQCVYRPFHMPLPRRHAWWWRQGLGVLGVLMFSVGTLCILMGMINVTKAHAASASGAWALTGSMKTARSHNTATLLCNGQVLASGGQDTTGALLATAELYNPATGMWIFTGSLNVARENQTATLLSNGEVLVAGGVSTSGGSAITSAELYDPATGMWSVTGSLNIARENHTSALLTNGEVLGAGGDTGQQNNPDIISL